MSLEENKALIRRFFAEVLNPWNVEALADFLVPNSFFSGFMQKFVAEGARGIPDAETTVNELFGENDKVTACTTQRGTNSGPLLGHPPTHKTVTLNAIWVFTIRDGKVISMQFQSDMAQQLWLS